MCFLYSIITVRSTLRIEEIPEEILNEFTYQGRIRFVDWFFNDSYWTKDDKSIWTTEYIETLRKDFQNGVLVGTYGKEVIHTLSTQLDQYLPNFVIILKYFVCQCNIKIIVEIM